MDNIVKCDLVDPPIGENIQELHKSLFRHLPSTTIPLYERKENESKKVRKSEKKFSPFVEMITPTIFIRKTTAIWFLQENEQLSSDHRFRVRIKQPFSSETIVSTSASSGMLDCDKLKGIYAVNKCASDKLNNSSKVVTESSSVIDLIDIPSDGDDALDDTWVNVEGRKLRYTDKDVILMKRWLWGTHFTIVQLLLK